MLIYYTVKQLQERLATTAAKINMLARLGILPTIPSLASHSFEYHAIEAWATEERLSEFIVEHDHSLYLHE